MHAPTAALPSPPPCAAVDGNKHVGLRIDRIKWAAESNLLLSLRLRLRRMVPRQPPQLWCSCLTSPCRCRRRYWLAVGAQPSDRVLWLLGRAGILPTPPTPPRLIPLKKDEKKK